MFLCNIIVPIIIIITYIMVFVDTVNGQDRWCRQHSPALATHLYARPSFIVITFRVVVVCDRSYGIVAADEAVAGKKTWNGYR